MVEVLERFGLGDFTVTILKLEDGYGYDLKEGGQLRHYRREMHSRSHATKEGVSMLEQFRRKHG